MGSATDFLENELLDHATGVGAYTFPSTVYVGLFTVAPTDSTAGTECSGGSYARVAADFAIASAGATALEAAATFPEATGSWGTVVAWGIFDASSAGNLMWYGDVSPTKAVTTGDTPSFAIGELDISIT